MMGACVRYYHSKQGDTVDSIAWEIYERQDPGLISGILVANPGLADFGPLLPAGLRLAIPDAPQAEVVVGVRLWT